MFDEMVCLSLVKTNTSPVRNGIIWLKFAVISRGTRREYQNLQVNGSYDHHLYKKIDFKSNN